MPTNPSLGDPVTLVDTRDPLNGPRGLYTGRITHFDSTTIWYEARELKTNNGRRRHDCEGVTWIRGHHERDSEAAQALLATYIIWRLAR